VTREDVLRLLYPDYQEYIQDIISSSEEYDAFDKDFSDILQIKTKDIMKKRVLTAYPDTQIMQALARMIANHVDQLPIVQEYGKLVSIITKSDIFYALYKANKKRIFVQK
jgi:CBS-domain-containing membrane protein